MAANAPYYQVGSDQFITTPNSTNATPSRFVTGDDECATVVSPHEQHTSMYPEHTVRQTSVDTTMHSTEGNHNLEELLEAATTTEGQAAPAMDAHDAVAASTAGPSKGKGKGKGKRKRAATSPIDEDQSRGTSENSRVLPSSASLLNQARAAGVHSAAALFRPSSERTSSRKYTRQPMAKLFMSLQLSPENFLQLQARAKAYMLDTAYPERQTCVGNRGGDTDTVKLRLFHCVVDFLTTGAGVEFFGEHVEQPGEQDVLEAARALGEDMAPYTGEKLIWPRHGNKLIGLVMPLCRRMVTNERQRIYAIESRKGGAKRQAKKTSVEAGTQHVHAGPYGNSGQGYDTEQQLLPAFDPGYARGAQTSQPASPFSPLVLSPVTPGPFTIADMVKSGRMSKYEPPIANWGDVDLPTEGPAVPCIKSINIFLVLADHVLPSGTVKPGVKLDEKRLVSNGPTLLTDRSWDFICAEVKKLIKRAKDKYPAVRDSFVPVAHRNTNAIAATDSPSTLPNSLRELAAAANAIQNTGPSANEKDQGLAQLKFGEMNAAERSSAEMMRPLNKEGNYPSVFAAVDHNNPQAPPELRVTVKTIGPNGWEYISNDAQWRDLLLRRGFDIWADGFVNLIATLVDVPVPVGRSTGGPLVNVPATNAKGKGKAKVIETDRMKEYSSYSSDD